MINASIRNGLVYAATLFFLAVALVSAINTYRHVNEPFPGFLVNERLRVSNVASPGWSGIITGLKYPDKLLEIDGQQLHSLDQLKEYIWARPVGTSINYKVEHGGEAWEVAIPTMLFTPGDLVVAMGATFLLGIVYVFLGFVVYVMKPEQRSGQIFYVLCLFLGLYSVTILDISWLDSGVVRIYMAAAAMFPAAAVHLSMLFPEQLRFAFRHGWLQVIPYIVGLFLAISNVTLYPGDSLAISWQGTTVFTAFSMCCFIAITLRTFIRSQSMLGRQRAKTVLFGAALAFPLPAIVYSVQMAGAGFQNVPLGIVDVTLVMFPLAIAYAIIRHNLFDVDSYVKRTVGYVMMTAILAGGYLGLQSIVRYTIGPVFGDAAEHVYPLLFAILVVFLFNPVNTRIQSFIDRVFYRKEYDFKEVVQNVEKSLASVIDINERMKRLVSSLKETLFLDTAGVAVYAPGNTAGNAYFEISSEETDETFQTRDIRIENSNPLTNLVISECKIVTRFDVEEERKYSGKRQQYIDQFDRLNSSICVPLTHNDETFGVVFLGDKKSGKFFNKQDIDLIRLISARGAVAIDNAQLVEQMKKEEEVRGNLARYLSPEIVDRVVSDDMEVNLGGQRKVVSVLFSDIRGFTTISESWPPNQLVTILNEYMTEMVAVVFENKGSIDKFVGDAIVAVFGSLVEVDNHAQQAVRSALGMQRRLIELNGKWQQEYGVELGIGVGINTGEVFLGNIGSPDRMEFTVIGDAVNLASRLEGLTKFYGVGVVVGESTRASLDNMLCRKLDIVRVKGKKEAVAIYEPVCELGDASHAIKGEIKQYETALTAYYAQDFDLSESIFKDMKKQFPNKKIYQIYLDRIPELRNMSLDVNWNGLFTHTSK